MNIVILIQLCFFFKTCFNLVLELFTPFDTFPVQFSIFLCALIDGV